MKESTWPSLPLCPIFKHCTKCDATKPLAGFSTSAKTPDGVAYHCKACKATNARAWARANPERNVARVRQWKADNPDRARENEQRHRQSARYQETRRAWQKRSRSVRQEKDRARYLSDPDRYKRAAHRFYARQRAANPARLAEQRRQWARANPAKVREVRRRRWARHKYAATVARVPANLVALKMVYWGSRCWMCHGPFEHVDHVKPLAKGGAHMLCNFRPACRACNQHKNAAWPFPTTGKGFGPDWWETPDA